MRPARLSVAIALALSLALLSACGGDDEEPAAPTRTQAECQKVEAPPVKDQSFRKPAKVLTPGEPATASVQTSCGTFVIKLDTERSPETANSFAFLAEQGFYDGLVFHRVVPGFVIQGGDPKGADPKVAGSGGPGYSVREPPPQRAEYTRAVVAMAKTEIEPPGTSGSQFFVVTAEDAQLPPQYALLGKVTSGQEVVDTIGTVGTDPTTEAPLAPVVFESVTLNEG